MALVDLELEEATQEVGQRLAWQVEARRGKAGVKDVHHEQAKVSVQPNNIIVAAVTAAVHKSVRVAAVHIVVALHSPMHNLDNGRISKHWRKHTHVNVC